MWRRHAAALAIALLLAACNPAGATADPSALAATKIADCVKAHGMTGPTDRVDPPAPTIRGETTTMFRSCEWPPPAYAQSGYAASGGYSEIRVTRIPWPEKAEVTNASGTSWWS